MPEANVAQQLMCKHECCVATNALRANVFDDFSPTQFQQRSSNNEVLTTKFQLRSSKHHNFVFESSENAIILYLKGLKTP